MFRVRFSTYIAMVVQFPSSIDFILRTVFSYLHLLWLSYVPICMVMCSIYSIVNFPYNFEFCLIGMELYFGIQRIKFDTFFFQVFLPHRVCLLRGNHETKYCRRKF